MKRKLFPQTSRIIAQFQGIAVANHCVADAGGNDSELQHVIDKDFQPLADVPYLLRLVDGNEFIAFGVLPNTAEILGIQHFLNADFFTGA